MPLTRREYTGNGSTTLYNVDFNLGYIDKNYVYVYLEGSEPNDQINYTWRNNNQIELSQAVADGYKFYIRRIVPRDQLVNDYANGAILREEDLNDSYTQLLMLFEEVQDGFITVDDEFLIGVKTILGDILDMSGNSIINVGDPIDGTDAANKHYVDSLTTSNKSRPIVVENPTSNIVTLPYPAKYAQVEVDGRILPPTGEYYNLSDDGLSAVINIDPLLIDYLVVRIPLVAEIIEDTELELNYTDPKEYGAIYGEVDGIQRAINTQAVQQAVDENDNLWFSGLLQTSDSVVLRNQLSFSAAHRGNGIICYHAFNPTFKDNTLEAADDQGNNTHSVTFSKMHVRSVNADCFHMTPYQCKWEGCFFRAGRYPFKIHDGGYQVENKWVDNYFYRFKVAIEAADGGDSRFRKLTDTYMKDNYYYTVGTSELALDLYGASGTLIDGDHYYGDYTDHMVRIGGINVRIANCYFEAMDQPRLYIRGGNPSSISVTGCSFWGGAGTGSNSNGDPRGLISVSFSAYNRSSATFIGNTFEGGTSSCPIFIIRNGEQDQGRYHKVTFGKDNLLNGSYVKAVKGLGTNALTTWAIQSDHQDFEIELPADGTDIPYVTASKILITSTAAADEFMTLPFDTAWLGSKEIIVQHVGTQSNITLSSGGASFYNDERVIEPLCTYRLTEYRDDGTYKYRLTKLSTSVSIDNSGKVSAETDTISTLNFNTTTIPANGEIRSTLSFNGTQLTSANDIFICRLKSLPVGVSATVYYDQSLDNIWKVKLVNATGSDIVNTAHTAIITKFT